jgi:hypothetical protein
VRFRSEFFHVPGKIELQGIQSAANIAALLFWQGFQLLSRLFFDLKPVTHRRVAAIDYCPCPENPRRLLIGKDRFDKGAAATDAKRRPGFQTSSPRPAHGGQAIRSPIRAIRGSSPFSISVYSLAAP